VDRASTALSFLGCLKRMQHVRHGVPGFPPWVCSGGAQILRAGGGGQLAEPRDCWKTDALQRRGRRMAGQTIQFTKSSSPLSLLNCIRLPSPIAAPSSCPRERLHQAKSYPSASSRGLHEARGRLAGVQAGSDSCGLSVRAAPARSSVAANSCSPPSFQGRRMRQTPVCRTNQRDAGVRARSEAS